MHCRIIEYGSNYGPGHVVLLHRTLMHDIYMHMHAEEEEYLIHMVATS